MSNARLIPLLAAPLLIAAGPAVPPSGYRLTMGAIFLDADPTIKLLMLVLVICAVAAVVVTLSKVASGPRLTGGSAFVSALRLGGPLVGLLGAAFITLMMFIGMANSGPAPMFVLAPGLAEAVMVLGLGILSGVIGVICHWVLDARIDRTVLSS